MYCFGKNLFGARAFPSPPGASVPCAALHGLHRRVLHPCKRCKTRWTGFDSDMAILLSLASATVACLQPEAGRPSASCCPKDFCLGRQGNLESIPRRQRPKGLGCTAARSVVHVHASNQIFTRSLVIAPHLEPAYHHSIPPSRKQALGSGPARPFDHTAPGPSPCSR
jgi:hypothetical protein